MKGSADLGKPKVQDPPLGGWLGCAGEPKVQHPPLEGVLGLSRKSKIQDPPLAPQGPVTASETALKEKKSPQKRAYFAYVTQFRMESMKIGSKKAVSSKI